MPESAAAQSPVNLPARVNREGSAIVAVLQWRQHLALTPETQYALGIVVAAYPDLNTEDRVDYLADLAGYHGHQIDSDLMALLGENSVERVYLAIDLLYQQARRDHSGGRHEDLDNLLGFFETCERLNINLEPEAVELLSDVIDRLGGLESACRAADHEVLKATLRSDEFGDVDHTEAD